MEKRSLHLAIGIVVVFMFLWMGYRVGRYVKTAGQDIKKAEEKVVRVGKKIAGIVREVKVCAANFVPLGTILRIEGYGMCVVLDRTHRRFAHRVDIAMRENEIEEARQFGLRKRVVEAVH